MKKRTAIKIFASTVFIFLTLFSQVASADFRVLYISNHDAEKISKFVKVGTVVRHFSWIQGDTEWKEEKVSKIEFLSLSGDYNELRLNGEGVQVQDVYVQHGDKRWQNLAMLVGIKTPAILRDLSEITTKKGHNFLLSIPKEIHMCERILEKSGEGGVTSEMIRGARDYGDCLQNLIINVANLYYPVDAFGEEGITGALADIEKARSALYWPLYNDCIICDGTMWQIQAAGVVADGFETILKTMVEHILSEKVPFPTISPSFWKNPDGENSGDNHYKKGLNYAAEGKFLQAREEYKEALKINPGDNISKSALKFVEDAVASRVKKKAAVHFFKGTELINKGSLDKAISEYTKAIIIDPEYAATYINRGAAYDYKGRYYLAIGDYTKAIELDKNFTDAYYNRGRSYASQGQDDLAIADFTKALGIDADIDPVEKAEIYANRALAYGSTGKYDLAIADFTKALKINPAVGATVYYFRGKAYDEKGQSNLAFTDYTKAIEIDPDFASAYINRGIIYDDTGRSELAIADYTKAIGINPQFARAYYNRAAAYDNKGQYDHAISDYTRALEINPKYTYAYYSRGNHYSKKGRYDMAISDYTKTIETDPEFVIAYLRRGLIYMTELNEKEKACNDFKKACELGECEVYDKSKGKGLCE